MGKIILPLHSSQLCCQPRFIHTCVMWWWEKYKCLDKYIQKRLLDTHVKCHPPKQSVWLAFGINEWVQVELNGCLNPTQITVVAIGNHCNMSAVNLPNAYKSEESVTFEVHTCPSTTQSPNMKNKFWFDTFWFFPEIFFLLIPTLKDSVKVHMQNEKLKKPFQQQLSNNIYVSCHILGSPITPLKASYLHVNQKQLLQNIPMK